MLMNLLTKLSSGNFLVVLISFTSLEQTFCISSSKEALVAKFELLFEPVEREQLSMSVERKLDSDISCVIKSFVSILRMEFN